MSTNKGESGKTWLNCEQCSERFTSPAAFEVHQVMHDQSYSPTAPATEVGESDEPLVIEPHYQSVITAKAISGGREVYKPVFDAPTTPQEPAGSDVEQLAEWIITEHSYTQGELEAKLQAFGQKRFDDGFVIAMNDKYATATGEQLAREYQRGLDDGDNGLYGKDEFEAEYQRGKADGAREERKIIDRALNMIIDVSNPLDRENLIKAKAALDKEGER